jgi:hypothetical protein
MTTDPERIHKDRIIQEILSEIPGISPKLLSAAIRIPRSPFFPVDSLEDLFSDRRQTGWGNRPVPTVKETLRILGELALLPGDRVAVYRPTDPYFLLLLLEMTHRITLIEENGDILRTMRIAMSDLGHAYIRFSFSYDEIKEDRERFRYFVSLGGLDPATQLPGAKDHPIPPETYRIWRLSNGLEKVIPGG